MRNIKYSYDLASLDTPILVLIGYEDKDDKVRFSLAAYEKGIQGLRLAFFHSIYKFDFRDKCGMTYERFKEVYPEKIFLHEVRLIGDSCIFGEVPNDLFERLKVFWG